MKIIKHGKQYEQENNIAECECGCKFQYDENEILYTRNRNDYDGAFDYKVAYTFVKCPECNREFVGRKIIKRCD